MVISDFFTCASNHNCTVIHKIQPVHEHLVHQAANVIIHLENKNLAVNLYSYNAWQK